MASSVRSSRTFKTYGWHANGIPGEGSSPDWAYSVGLFAKYGRPELIVFGLEIATIHEMISRYADLMQAGKEFRVGLSGTVPDFLDFLLALHVVFLHIGPLRHSK